MFVAAGSFPMSQWAIGKHKRLRKVTASLNVLDEKALTDQSILCIPACVWPLGQMALVRCGVGQLRGVCGMQMFDGTGGKPKYPKRWVVFPPFL